LPPFSPKLANSAINLIYTTSWTTSNAYASLIDGNNWYEAPEFASIALIGYDTSVINIQTDFTGTPKNIINMTIKYIGTPVASGSTTVQVSATDVYGRKAATSMMINWSL
jgi:hypothetical protein